MEAITTKDVGVNTRADDLKKTMEYEIYAGAAGKGFAAEFVGFLKIARKLPNPDTILMNPEKAQVPEEPAVVYALCGALARKATDGNFSRVVKYANRLPADFSVLMIRDSISYDPDLAKTKAFINWASEHSEFLS
jgi:hypothetical protein